MIIHAHDGSRIACSLLSSGAEALVASAFVPYFSYSGELAVAGTVEESALALLHDDHAPRTIGRDSVVDQDTLRLAALCVYGEARSARCTAALGLSSLYYWEAQGRGAQVWASLHGCGRETERASPEARAYV